MLPLFQTCVCDSDVDDERLRRDGLAPRPDAAGPRFDPSMEIQVPACAPKVRGFQAFSSSPDQPLLGVPIREGSLWHLSAQDRFEPVQFSLYVNGFAFCTADGFEASVSLSPFSLVRNCRFQSGEAAKLKSFKVSLMEPDPCCYFAVRNDNDREAEEERSEWVLGLSHTMLLITDSLLPSFSVTCQPLPGAPCTSRRLMAGYLLHRDDNITISVVFCELSAHSHTGAMLSMYENELCEVLIAEVCLNEASMCCDVIGINCSCFMVDGHHFAAQTPSERKLWLRALSNVKVKIQNRAPDPTDEELEYYRDSIREHIVALQATLEPRIVNDPLLSRCARKPAPQALRPPSPGKESPGVQAGGGQSANSGGKPCVGAHASL
mmetsp:Transcript_51578/g.149907  ORF Transcript_51578/g.149907 Transcript_51578/m.149907 type:complete len:378 (-) Transcript_51578:359-1492(-)